jgi:hypothetical protein
MPSDITMAAQMMVTNVGFRTLYGVSGWGGEQMYLDFILAKAASVLGLPRYGSLDGVGEVYLAIDVPNALTLITNDIINPPGINPSTAIYRLYKTPLPVSLDPKYTESEDADSLLFSIVATASYNQNSYLSWLKSVRFVKQAGGNWSSSGTWEDPCGGNSLEPTIDDDVHLDNVSGDIVIDSINCVAKNIAIDDGKDISMVPGSRLIVYGEMNAVGTNSNRINIRSTVPGENAILQADYVGRCEFVDAVDVDSRGSAHVRNLMGTINRCLNWSLWDALGV